MTTTGPVGIGLAIGHGFLPQKALQPATVVDISRMPECYLIRRYAAAVLGECVPTTDGKWITRLPSRCPNGHPLGPNQVLVGHVACLGHGGGGHTSWHCRICDAVVYGPPLNIHCTALEGPATVRISTAR